jgi:hypothetical protein
LPDACSDHKRIGDKTFLCLDCVHQRVCDLFGSHGRYELAKRWSMISSDIVCVKVSCRRLANDRMTNGNTYNTHSLIIQLSIITTHTHARKPLSNLFLECLETTPPQILSILLSLSHLHTKNVLRLFSERKTFVIHENSIIFFTANRSGPWTFTSWTIYNNNCSVIFCLQFRNNALTSATKFDMKSFPLLLSFSEEIV